MNQNPEAEIREKTEGLRILILSWEYHPNIIGGLSKHVFGLSKQLVQLGADVYVITAGWRDLPAVEKQNGITIYRTKPLNEQDEQFLSWVGGFNLVVIYKVINITKKIKFSLIHAHDWLVGTAAIILKDELKVPLLSTIHSTEYGRNRGIHNEMQRFIHRKEQQLIEESDQVIVCSEYMKLELHLIFKKSTDKITVIPNGIDFVNRKGAAVREFFLKEEKKTLIFSIGRMVKEKGFDTIIEAAEHAKKFGIPVFFIVAGKGPMLDSYRSIVVEKSLENYLAFIGFISEEEKVAYLAESDMNVFPSLYEPFGIVALESMIYGKPTIVSNTGGLKGIIQHKETGLLMVPGRAESLIEQILWLINNPMLATEIGRKGYETVIKFYGWRQAALKTIQVIEDLIIP